MRHFIVVKAGIARYMQCEDFTDAAREVAEWLPEDRALVTSVREVAPQAVPNFSGYHDPFLRNAWEDDGNAVTVNLSKAKANLKAKRAAEGKPKKDAEIDAATTVDELKALLQ